MTVVQVNNRLFIDGFEVKSCPPILKFSNLTVVNDNVIYYNGWEYRIKEGQWRRSLKALWRWLFSYI